MPEHSSSRWGLDVPAVVPVVGHRVRRAPRAETVRTLLSSLLKVRRSRIGRS